MYAHPDDPEISCGGTLARWAAGGCEVHLLLLTRGDKGSGDPADHPDELAARRAREVAEAAQVLGLAGWAGLPVDDGDLAFRKYIHDLVDRGRVRVLVDLGALTYIDSSGIGMLAAKLKTVREHGGDLRLLHLNPKGQRLFGMLKLRTAFEIFDDEPTAIRSFARPAI